MWGDWGIQEYVQRKKKKENERGKNMLDRKHRRENSIQHGYTKERNKLGQYSYLRKGMGN